MKISDLKKVRFKASLVKINTSIHVYMMYVQDFNGLYLGHANVHVLVLLIQVFVSKYYGNTITVSERDTDRVLVED